MPVWFAAREIVGLLRYAVEFPATGVDTPSLLKANAMKSTEPAVAPIVTFIRILYVCPGVTAIL